MPRSGDAISSTMLPCVSRAKWTALGCSIGVHDRITEKDIDDGAYHIVICIISGASTMKNQNRRRPQPC
jgi:hypothetical protein